LDALEDSGGFKVLPVGVDMHYAKFRVRIGIDGTRRHLGSFSTLKEAIAAQDREIAAR
jgi:hypothetical protein